MDRSAFSIQYENQLLKQFWELFDTYSNIRITSITKDSFFGFFDIGYSLLSALPEVLQIFRREDKDFDNESTWHILISEKLIEQCMRWGHWRHVDDVMRFIDENCLYSISWIADMKNEIYQKHEAADCIVSFLRECKEPCSKNKVLRENVDIQRDYANWAMRFYKGIKTEKRGSTTYVSCDEEFFGG